MKNSLAIESGASVWYDLSSLIGLHAGLRYAYNRPKATTTVGGFSVSETWNTDYVGFSAGAAIGLF